MSAKVVLVISLVAILCHSAQPKPSFFDDKKSDPDYSGCDQTYQCFGIPNACYQKKECVVLLKTQPMESGVQFQLYWTRDQNSTDRYVAAGLSDDNKMGNDSVTIFELLDSGKVTEDQGLTFGGKDFGVNFVNVSGFDNFTVNYENGLFVGSWIRAEDTTVDKMDFNMKTNKYYILLAFGPIDDSGLPKHHTDQSVSDGPVDLETNSGTETTTSNSTTPIPSTTASPTTGSGNSSTTPAPSSTGGPTTTTEVSPTSGNHSSSTLQPSTTPAPGIASTVTLNLILAIFVIIFTFVN